ncbi:LAME_0C09054g1_1 [Lachancea meyersii CBS 8951]|uniref:LAME_0C09054g1_1 n=1 Tax=Lachancea meyersii CBS 8951 TaxID=1266667 RepID=A0A1G4J3Z4_9SACH|nr:LAME_0C09054g1_1 [Lachancea meyersii CBS 8951]
MSTQNPMNDESGSSYGEHHEFMAAMGVDRVPESGSSNSEKAGSVSGFNGQYKQESPENGLQRKESRLERVMTGFFSERVRDVRKKLITQFLFNHLALALLILSVFSLYWGAMYDKPRYFHKIKILAVIQDDGAVSQPLPSLIDTVPGHWHVYSSSSFQENYHVSESQIDTQITKLIHEQKFWMSLNVKPNATNVLIDSLQNSSAQPFNSSAFFEMFFESGRDPTNFKSSILPLMTELEAKYQATYSSKILPQIMTNLSDSLANVPSVNVAQAGSMLFSQVDYRPFDNFVLLGPLQVGLIYCILLTFFQLLLFAPMHAEFAQKLKVPHMILYRYLIATINYFFLSLFFCLVSLAFQVDYGRTYGRSGFLVAWMASWLLMMAVGGANENMLTLLAALAPRFSGFWMIFWVVLNISPSFYPMDLVNNVYRYGYILPIFNGVGIFRVIFLNIYPGHLGRNFGVLCAWIVLNMLLFPLCAKVFATQKKRRP